MVGVRVKADFSDVERAFRAIGREVEEACEDVGEQAVDYARAHGSYRDRTGTLRRSNRHEAGEDGLTLVNDAESPEGHHYASDVESRGYEVLTGAALFAERELQGRTR